MRLRIKELNFSSKYNWIYKLVDEYKKEYFIMDSQFYDAHHLKSPINKHHLDSYDKETSIKAEVGIIDSLKCDY
jgi:hypothetical protein